MEVKENAVNGHKALESFFSQLRHLAGEVDTKVHSVKENLAFKKCFPEQSQDHASTNLFLVNTKREITKEFEQVKMQFCEFDQSNSEFFRMQDLMKSVLTVHEQRSEKLLNFLESYGYNKPDIGSNNVALVKESHKPEPGNEDSDLLQSTDESAEDSPEKELSSVSSTPQSKTNVDKEVVRRTPKKREDLYGKLSENTILFLKGAKSHSEDCGLNTLQTSSSSDFSLFDKTRPAGSNSTTNAEKFSSNWLSSVKGKNLDIEDGDTLVLNNHRFADLTLTKMSKSKANSFFTEDKHLYGKHLSSINAAQSMMKSNEQRKSPVFQDVYGMLSESTISLLKHTYNKSASAENLSERHISDISDSFRDTEQAELNSSIKPNDKSLSESIIYNCTPALCSSLNKSSNTTSKTTATNQDFHTSESQQGNLYSEFNRKNPKCARSLLYTGPHPPAQETTTNLTSSYPHVSSNGKENLPASKRFEDPPEPPKLLSRALIQDLYNSKY